MLIDIIYNVGEVLLLFECDYVIKIISSDQIRFSIDVVYDYLDIHLPSLKQNLNELGISIESDSLIYSYRRAHLKISSNIMIYFLKDSFFLLRLANTGGIFLCDQIDDLVDGIYFFTYGKDR